MTLRKWLAPTAVIVLLLLVAYCSGRCHGKGKVVEQVNVTEIEEAMKEADLTIANQVKEIERLKLANGDAADIIAVLESREPRTVTRTVTVREPGERIEVPVPDLTGLEDVADCRNRLGGCRDAVETCLERLPTGPWLLWEDISGESLGVDCRATLARSGPVVGGKLEGEAWLVADGDRRLETGWRPLRSVEVTVLEELAPRPRAEWIGTLEATYGDLGGMGVEAGVARFGRRKRDGGARRFGWSVHAEMLRVDQVATRANCGRQIVTGTFTDSDWRVGAGIAVRVGGQ